MHYKLRTDIGCLSFLLHLWSQVREGERLRLHPDGTASTPARDQQLSQRGREGAGGEAGSQQRCPGVLSIFHFACDFLFALLAWSRVVFVSVHRYAHATIRLVVDCCGKAKRERGERQAVNGGFQVFAFHVLLFFTLTGQYRFGYIVGSLF